MLRFVIGLFIVLHGLVHLWYFILSQRLVEFKPEMGWSGRSWVFTNLVGDSTTRSLAGALYIVATIAFVVSGVGIFVRADWWRPVLVGSAAFSAVIIFLLWDGRMQFVVEKGLIGFLIGLGILVGLLVLQWPAAAF